MLVIAAIEKYCFLRRSVAPVWRRIVQRGITRTGCLEPCRVNDRVGLVRQLVGGSGGVEEGEGDEGATGRDGA